MSLLNFSKEDYISSLVSTLKEDGYLTVQDYGTCNKYDKVYNSVSLKEIGGSEGVANKYIYYVMQGDSCITTFSLGRLWIPSVLANEIQLQDGYTLEVWQ